MVIKKVILVLIPTMFIILLIVVNINLDFIRTFLPNCLFNTLTGLKCPGCGNTRSVIALMNGDILGSLRYNIFPIVSLILLTLLYIEQCFSVFSSPRKIFPRNTVFWICFAVAIVLYWGLRCFL